MTKSDSRAEEGNSANNQAVLMSEQIIAIKTKFTSAEKIEEDLKLCSEKYYNSDSELVKTLINRINNNLISYLEGDEDSNGYKKWVKKINNIGCALDEKYSIKKATEREQTSFDKKPETFKEFFHLAKGKKGVSEKILGIKDKNIQIYKRIAKDLARQKSKEIALDIFNFLPEEYKEDVNDWYNILDFRNPETINSLSRVTSLNTNRKRLLEAQQETETDNKKEKKVTINLENNTVKILTPENSQDTESTEEYSPEEDLQPETSPQKNEISNLNSLSANKNNQSHGH